MFVYIPPSDEGGGKIYDFDGGRDKSVEISPPVSYADSSLVRWGKALTNKYANYSPKERIGKLLFSPNAH